MDDDIERLADELIGDITGWHPIGWQGAAQHTYTMACDGFHAPGPCPQSAIDAYQEASNELHYLTGD